MINEIPTYTFFHDSFTKNTADILITSTKFPIQYGFNYFVLKDLDYQRIDRIYEEEIGKCIDRSEARMLDIF